MVEAKCPFLWITALKCGQKVDNSLKNALKSRFFAELSARLCIKSALLSCCDICYFLKQMTIKQKFVTLGSDKIYGRWDCQEMEEDDGTLYLWD